MIPPSVAALPEEARIELHELWCRVVSCVWRIGNFNVEGAARWLALFEAEAVRKAGVPGVRIDERALRVRADELDPLVGDAAINNFSRGPVGGFGAGVVTYRDCDWEIESGKRNPFGFSGGSGEGVGKWSPYRAGLDAGLVEIIDAALAPGLFAAPWRSDPFKPTRYSPPRGDLNLDGDDLRRRTHAICHPDDQPSGDPAATDPEEFHRDRSDANHL